MRKLFSEIPSKPRYPHQSDVFYFNEETGRNHLKHDVFDRAFSHVRLDSTPGFPYECPTNADVPRGDLYDRVDRLLHLWHTEAMPDDALVAFQRGFTYPATAFVKNEPTKTDKIARLIYGTSVVMNVVGRIFFADYITHVVDSWDIASHKVGLDFLSPEGLSRFTRFFDSIDPRVRELCVSDDIQGWEYMCRDWMHETFFEVYLEQSDYVPFTRHMLEQYCRAEKLILFLTSDGLLNAPDMYFGVSGRLLTHFQNSMERGALGLTDAVLSKTILSVLLEESRALCAMNGDDYFGPVGAADSFSARLGFVHTDQAPVTSLSVNFCSQEFYRYQPEVDFKRKPDGLAKTVYNLFCARDQSARLDILNYIGSHEAFDAVCAWYFAVNEPDVASGEI